ncbi:MAG: hypothetical protein AB8G22_19360, partial [Saprospiraceae bacterium]
MQPFYDKDVFIIYHFSFFQERKFIFYHLYFMLNRTIAPPIKDIEKIRIPTPVRYELDNGIPVYEVNIGTQEIVKLEVIFNAGRPYEKVQLAARTTASLLKEGTQQYSAETIAKQIDFYGGT